MTHAVEAVDLAKRYRSKGGEVEAVRGIDLAVPTGSVFGFLGPNGAGKSTTVRMLTTLMTITSGSARVAGVDVAADPDAAAAASASPCRRPGSIRARPVASCSAPVPALRAAVRRGRRARPGAAALVELEDAADRRGQGLLRRDEAPARPGLRARAPSPRCCSSTSPPPGSTRPAG